MHHNLVKGSGTIGRWHETEPAIIHPPAGKLPFTLMDVLDDLEPGLGAREVSWLTTVNGFEILFDLIPPTPQQLEESPRGWDITSDIDGFAGVLNRNSLEVTGYFAYDFPGHRIIKFSTVFNRRLGLAARG